MIFDKALVGGLRARPGPVPGAPGPPAHNPRCHSGNKSWPPARTGRTIVLVDQEFWDAMYTNVDFSWSGNPNGALVDEVTGLPAGRALDVGCGDGSDARWLAAQGWRVTAVDISQVALDRAAAVQTPHEITWRLLDLAKEAPAETYDLVSAHYLPILKTAPDTAKHLIGAVAPGGRLLLVAHDTPAEGAFHGHDGTEFPYADFASPADVRALLGDGWTIETDVKRDRALKANNHHVDIILRARRDA